jgi:hypothetical protein
VGSHTLARLCLIVAVPLLLLAPADLFGAQVTPLLQEGELGVLLQQMSLPPTLRKDLVSGLTNKVAIRFILQGAQPAQQRLVAITVKYDLWEETFGVKIMVDNMEVVATSCRTVDEVISMLTHLSVPRLFRVDASGTAPGMKWVLTAEILFDPIEKARMEEIGKWVAENNRPAPPDPSSLGSALPAVPSTTSRVFNRIFEHYTAGDSIAATWKQTASSTPFRLEDLRSS